MKLAAAALAAAALAGATVVPQAAQARGCIAGAAVGGVAGHYAGRHPILGAVGGCLVGRHIANKRYHEQRRYQAQQQGAYYRR